MRLIALYHIVFNKWWINEICDKTMCFHIAYFCSLGSQNPASIEQIFFLKNGSRKSTESQKNMLSWLYQVYLLYSMVLIYVTNDWDKLKSKHDENYVLIALAFHLL